MSGLTGWKGWNGGGGQQVQGGPDGSLVDAILSMRRVSASGNLNVNRGYVRGCPPNGLPPTEETTQAQLNWWSAAVRQQLGHFELTSCLRFTPPPQAGGAARLWHVDIDPTNPQAASAAPLVSMTRPSRDYFNAQLINVEVQSNKVLYTDTIGMIKYTGRLAEASAEMVNPAALVGAFANIDPSQLPATVELLELTRGFVADACQRFKHALVCPRPNDYAARMRPLIQTPAHGTLPMGHAAEAYAVTTVLGTLLGADVGTLGLLSQYAHRVAENRILLAVHFPVDASAGRMLGEALAHYVAQLCGATLTQLHEAIFDGPNAGLGRHAARGFHRQVRPGDRPARPRGPLGASQTNAHRD